MIDNNLGAASAAALSSRCSPSARRREAGGEAAIHVFAHAVLVRGDGDRLVRVRVLEMRLSAAKLAIWVQLAEKQLTAGPQHARRLGVDRTEAPHMLEHEVAHHDVHR